jgi:iron-sulfur cluster repair protein YtfE (RIC family)
MAEESIYSVLAREHKDIQRIFEEIFKKQKDFSDEFRQLQERIVSHLQGEEQYFYPILGGFADLKSLILEAFEEHRISKVILNELKDTDYDDEEFLPKLKVLKELLEHHISEEEQEIFPESQKKLSKEQESSIRNGYLSLKK